MVRLRDPVGRAMAIYHLNAQIVKRSEGASAVAGAAYRAGEQLVDERTGEVHDYRRKAVDGSVILTPAGAPAWTRNRAQLWNRAEAAERRGDAQVAREVRVAIPCELPAPAGRDLVRKFAEEQFVDRGMIADIGFHGEGGPNPHAHILLTMRPIDRDEFSKRKDRSWNDRSALHQWRESWADLANSALDAHGTRERIDHRTLEAQQKDAEARGDREAAIRLDRPPMLKRGRVLAHRPEKAPYRAVLFADAEAERLAAIRRAEEIIQLEALISDGTDALDRLTRELQAEQEAEQQAIIDVVPDNVRAEARRHAAEPPEPPPKGPPPRFHPDDLTAEQDRRDEGRPSTENEVKKRAYDAAPAADETLAANLPAGLAGLDPHGWREIEERLTLSRDGDRYEGVVTLTRDGLSVLDIEEMRREWDREFFQEAKSAAPPGYPIREPEAREEAIIQAVQQIGEATDGLINQAIGRPPAERPAAPPADVGPPATPDRAETPAAATPPSPPTAPGPPAAARTRKPPGLIRRTAKKLSTWLTGRPAGEPAPAQPPDTPAPAPAERTSTSATPEPERTSTSATTRREEAPLRRKGGGAGGKRPVRRPVQPLDRSSR